MPQAVPGGEEIAIATSRRRGALRRSRALALAGALLAVALDAALAQAPAPEAEAVARGAYIYRAAGCESCHTDPKRKDQPLAGGRALETAFGTFYTPNITPDPVHGIGAWSDEDFLRALQEGIAPDGRHYYPAFPYTSYSGMSDHDALDLKAYLFSRPGIAEPNRTHDLSFPFSFRILLGPWKALFFEPGRFAADPTRGATWNRGAYLVRHLGHCGECHTPRNVLGAREEERHLAGNPAGPEGKKVPNITPHEEAGIGEWSETDVTYFLKSGFFPDGDFAGGAMVEVIEDGTSRLSDADRAAIAAYLRTVPPQPGP